MPRIPSLLLGALLVAASAAPAWATTVTVDDTAADDTVTVTVTQPGGQPMVQMPDRNPVFEVLTFGVGNANNFIPLADVHPPKTVSSTAYFSEAGQPATVASDVVTVTLTPNDDGVSAKLFMTFQSDLDPSNLMIPANTPKGAIFAEANAGVDIGTMLNFGVPAMDFPTQANFHLIIKSDVETPEPAAITLMGLGLLGMAALIRRQRRRRAA